MRKQFRCAAREVVQRNAHAPEPRRKAKTAGGGGRQFKVRGVVEDYLELCRNPSKDWRRWLAEDPRERRAGQDFRRLIVKGGIYADAQRTKSVVAKAAGLRGESLPALRSGVDTDGDRGRGADRLPTRSRASAGRDDGLRPVRAEAGEGLGFPSGAAGCSYEAEAAEINALFAAKLAGLRRRLRPWEIPAAVKAITEELQAAFLALRERQKMEKTTGRENAHRKTFCLKFGYF